jgi:hypothetical protein
MNDASLSFVSQSRAATKTKVLLSQAVKATRQRGQAPLPDLFYSTYQVLLDNSGNKKQNRSERQKYYLAKL